jgi:hypothetical protein
MPPEENEPVTQTEQQPVVENQTETETQEQPVVQAEAGTEIETNTEEQPEKPVKKVDPLQKRIDTLTRARHDAERERDEARAELAKLKPTAATTEAPAAEAPDLDTLANQRAEQIVAQREFRTRVNAWAKAGETEFKDDWNDKCNMVANLGATERPEFMQIVTDPDLIKDGHKVVAALADDPEEAERILSLTPVKMSAALVKYAEKIGKPKAKPLSNAPEPIKPINGTAKASDEPTDKDSEDEWFRKREAQIKARNQGGARF